MVAQTEGLVYCADTLISAFTVQAFIFAETHVTFMDTKSSQ